MFKLISCAFFLLTASVVVAKPMDDVIQQLNQEIPGQIVTPKTTAELKELFKGTTDTEFPRIFVDRLPDDFAQNGSPELYMQVITSLVLRANERAIRDKMILTALKNKYEAKEEWSEVETAFFNSLVEKYDVVVDKTKATQLEKLTQKIDEVIPGLAVAQSVYATDWGKKNMKSPYSQMGWLDEKTYDYIPYDSLIKATDEYVKEMNGEPSHWQWRVRRQQAAHRRTRDTLAYTLAGSLRSYHQEDPLYTEKIQQILNYNRRLGALYHASLKD